MDAIPAAAHAAPFDTDELLAGIRAWVEIESPTDDPAAVNRAMDRAEADARAAGLSLQRTPGRDGFGDHLLLFYGPVDQPGILVLSHLDTVHPMGTLAGRLPWRVQDGSAFGPGVCDMKGGAYLALAALAHLSRSGEATPLPVRHLLVSDEEVGSPTSRALIEAEARRAKYVLVTEPAREGGKIVTARKGVARFDLRATGRPAHSGARHGDGRSAIKEMARQILALEAMTDPARGVTVNVGVVRGGTRANVVPEFCEAEVDMRVPDPATGEEMVARILDLRPIDPDVVLEVTGGLNRPPYVKDAAIAALFEHARGIASGLGLELADLTTGGGSDGNFTAALGVPTLDGLGADGRGGHTMEEQVYVAALVPRAALLLGLLRTLR